MSGGTTRREAVLLVHGGAGAATPSSLSSDRREAIGRALTCALEAGRGLLAEGKSAREAVLAAVVALEDAEELNAGRGAVLRDDGTIALDASVMWGGDRSGGAVAGVRHVRNPVRAAEAVRAAGKHVLLCGAGADDFARASGLVMVDPDYFLTSERVAQLERARGSQTIELDHHDAQARDPGFSGGTVGAVALDLEGHLAAATSTGGMTNAYRARIGDSPILGAGTWADDATCAVSATGMGESFLRAAFAHEIDAQIRLGGRALAEACEIALARAREHGGRGGCIAVDALGRIALPFNTTAMPRGCARLNGACRIAVFDGPLE